MNRHPLVRSMFGALALVAFAPALAFAQSTISGQVRDQSGAVLPGVTVEAASPVLIERVRSVTTDDQGRYAIVNLRPGRYKVTFSVTGFSTHVQDGIDLPADFTATANAELRVGALEETVLVSALSAVVDVQQAARTQVLTRELIDALPSTRNYFSFGQVMPGVRMTVPDVGGARSMEQTVPRVHGIGRDTINVTAQIDGMQVNSAEPNGSLPYIDDALNAEVSITTAAIPAEVSAGGARLNAIPKDGGNTVSGAVFIGGTDGRWQSDNVNGVLRGRGLVVPAKITHIQNYNAAVGGPVKRDSLWFFGSARHTSTDDQPANIFTMPDGSPGIEDQYVRDGLARLTWQVSPRNKFAIFLERIWKRKGHEFGFGTEPYRASTIRDPKHGAYAVGQAKWTTTLSNRLMLEGGYSFYMVHWTIFNQPYVREERGTPAWYANARRTDSVRGTAWQSAGADNRANDLRRVYSASTSYVTGSHNFKVGLQYVWDQDDRFRDAQADLIQNYLDGVPNTVSVYNTPNIVISRAHDVGVYAQDSWTIGRLTLNPGLRLEYFNGWNPEVSMPAGRFAPARFFPAQHNVPNWKHQPAPRFSAVYDLFGDGKTALKGSVSKYDQAWSAGFAQRYSPAVLANETRNWYDCDLLPGTSTCSGRVLATNRDDIAQDNEIGPAASATFGRALDRTLGDLERAYNIEYTAAIQRELLPRVSVSASYFHRTWKGLEYQDNVLISPADYTPFQIPNPMNASEMLTVYNLDRNKRGQLAIVDRNSDNNSSTYDGVEFAFTARVLRTTMFGGWTIERNVSVTCESDNANGTLGTDLYLGATLSNGGPLCDEGTFHIPFRNDIKLSGAVPLRWGLEAGAVLQSLSGSPKGITYAVPAAAFPGGRVESQTILLSRPGTLFQPRMNQLDLDLKKILRFGRKTVSGQVDVFNALNANSILTSNQAWGPTYDQVQTFLTGRMVRLAFQLKF